MQWHWLSYSAIFLYILFLKVDDVDMLKEALIINSTRFVSAHQINKLLIELYVDAQKLFCERQKKQYFLLVLL
jgi:hypothetical protein